MHYTYSRSYNNNQNAMKRKQVLFALFLICCVAVQAKEYHVSVKGDDANDGTGKAPFRTIGKAAEYAFPGDVITVHAGRTGNG